MSNYFRKLQHWEQKACIQLSIHMLSHVWTPTHTHTRTCTHVHACAHVRALTHTYYQDSISTYNIISITKPSFGYPCSHIYTLYSSLSFIPADDVNCSSRCLPHKEIDVHHKQIGGCQLSSRPGQTQNPLINPALRPDKINRTLCLLDPFNVASFWTTEDKWNASWSPIKQCKHLLTQPHPPPPKKRT